jgi:DnaJ-class molecular chaperone
MSNPHRCPVCEGTGKVIDSRLRDTVDCKACKGKGIVWEPKETQEASKPSAPGALDLTYDG